MCAYNSRKYYALVKQTKPTSKVEGIASALQLVGIEGRMELPGNAWVNTLVGIYHLSPTNPGSSLRSNLGEGRDNGHRPLSQHTQVQNHPTIAYACITSFASLDGSFWFALRSMPTLLVS